MKYFCFTIFKLIEKWPRNQVKRTFGEPRVYAFEAKLSLRYLTPSPIIQLKGKIHESECPTLQSLCQLVMMVSIPALLVLQAQRDGKLHHGLVGRQLQHSTLENNVEKTSKEKVHKVIYKWCSLFCIIVIRCVHI